MKNTKKNIFIIILIIIGLGLLIFTGCDTDGVDEYDTMWCQGRVFGEDVDFLFPSMGNLRSNQYDRAILTEIDHNKFHIVFFERGGAVRASLTLRENDLEGVAYRWDQTTNEVIFKCNDRY